MTKPGQRLVTARAAAARCGVDEKTVRRWIEQGLINAWRVGQRSVRVDLSEVEAKMIVPIPADDALAS